MDLVNDRVMVHEDPAGDIYQRIMQLTAKDEVRFAAGDGHVLMAAARLLP